MAALFAALQRAWYQPRLRFALWPLALLSFLFASLVALRRMFYRFGLLPRIRVAVPVVVAGNIAVGGTGKTPLAIALATDMRRRGWHPGLLSRGYGGNALAPRGVAADDDAAVVGDEALLLAATGLPVWVGRDRAAAAQALLAVHPECDVLIADDGLQHYRLERDIELAVIDAERGLGNGWLLPAGPLREGAARLEKVDAVIWNGGNERRAPHWRMRLAAAPARNLCNPQLVADPKEWQGRRVEAVAGIGNPERFFAQLAALGIEARTHAFADHHRFQAGDFPWRDAEVIVMTEKDAVKCKSFADERFWALPVRAELPEALLDWIEEKLRGCQTA